MYRIAICDDDNLFLKKINEVLNEVFNNYDTNIVIDEFNSGRVLIERIEKRKILYDIIFLDIEMPEIDGFSTAERLRDLNSNFLLIFITNMENEAPKGYRYSAFRFVVKSRLYDDINEAVKAIIHSTKKELAQNETIEFKYKYQGTFDYITIKKGDIIYLQSVGRRIYLKTLYGEYDLLVIPLKKYRDKLESENFIIVARSYIINLDHVKDIVGDYLQLTGDFTVCMGYSKVTKATVKKQYMLYKRERI